MYSFSTYIEYTLMTRHYAYVPGIGGFLLREIDASYKNHIYTPSHYEVHLNRFLTKNDGMLANAYMEANNLSFEQATSQIQFEVANIKNQLGRNNSYKLGNLGTLTYDSDHHLTLKNAKQIPFDTESYGLNALEIKTWKEIEEDRNKSFGSKKDTAEVVSIPTYWVKRVAAVVALLLCFLVDNNFDKKSNIYEYASLFDSEIVLDKLCPNTPTAQNWDELWETELTLSEVEANTPKEIIEETPKEEIVTEEPKVEIAAQTLNTTTPSKLYYIIIGSCTSSTEAEHFVKKRNSEGYENVGILEKDGRFRLYLKTFTDRAEGEKYLEEVRTTTPFQKAWLLPVRQESLLSFNYKKIDNDQLPMELSYSHKRTERDQGWINT